MAAASVPAMPVAATAGVTPCVGDVYEDIADVVLLMTVFVVGWVLCNKLAVVFGFRARARKTAPWAPAGAIPEPRKSCSADFDEIEPLVAGKGESPLHPAAAVSSPTKVADDLDFDFDKLCTPSCGKAFDSAPTVTPSPAGSLSVFGDFSPCGDFAGDFDMAMPTIADMCAPAEADEEMDILVGEGVDAKIRDSASRNDLAGCSRVWRAAVASAAAPVALSSSTCAVLAASMRRVAAAPADADVALEAAVASAHAELAEAALVAGARLRDAAWAARACGRLDAAGVPFRPEHYATLARAHGRERRADLAADLWRDRCAALGLAVGAGENDSVTFDEPLPLPELYTAALEACVSSGDFSSAWRLASASGWRAPATADGQAAMLALSRWLAKHQGVGVARRCIEGVRRAGGEPGPQALRVLFAASARAGDMKQAGELFGELMATSRTVPDFASYSLMVRGFGAIGDVENAMRYFQEMRQHGHCPEAALFDAILNACAARNLLGLAEEVLADMEASGARPTSATLAALVRLHAARGAPAAAAAIFEELPRRHGFEPDVRAYHALISACLSAGSTDLAFGVLSTMCRNGCIPTAKTYETLTMAALREGDLARAASLVEDALSLAADAAPTGAHGEEGPDAGAAGAAAAATAAAAVLERRVIEELLELTGRRREASTIGIPLLAKLQQAGVAVSARVSEALAQAAAGEQQRQGAQPTQSRSSRVARREMLDCWRKEFGRAVDVDTKEYETEVCGDEANEAP
eukprot:CAMPEP_0176177248 /NCGR_PEP_ID=MMETSP0120_2-20121206/90804_1 /TAXON_ID=160619 /ORGANISM="Kryptoperidinium foliaceum, Strain CCMP 1326" /LENGTH=755 /DNA_ID=CAMNT_0017515341 /DNA_START=138 /DNA_END=2403 /DNA_ORIENTATION=+